VARRLRQPAADAAGESLRWLWVACVAVAIDALLSGNLVMPVSQVWAATAFGLLWRQRSEARASDGSSARLAPGSRNRWGRRAGLATVLAASWLMLHGQVFSQAANLGAWLDHSISLSASPKLAPRYWSSGWF
jgi:hypothetical protein